MSWKGIAKAVARVPQRLRGETTHDTEFDDINARFAELAKRTEKLHTDAIKFRDAVSGMLNHQANFAEILEDIYNPVTGGLAAEVGTIRRTQTPAPSMKTVGEFSKVMTDIRDTILPELELIDRKVVQPASDFFNITKLITKTITKRDHKRIDYDRHRNALKKLKDKKDKSLSDEKALYKLEEQVDQSTKDYEHYNSLLKNELPMFFEYRTQFIEPIFQEFYHMQLKIYGLLLDRMEKLGASGYFDMGSDIMEGFDTRRGDIQEQIESLTLIGRKAKLERRDSDTSSISETNSEIARSPSSLSTTGASRSRRVNIPPLEEKDYYDEDDNRDYEDVPPAYTPTSISTPSLRNINAVGTSSSSSRSSLNAIPKFSTAAAVAANKVPPPRPPTHTKPRPSLKYVIALYDYEAQADGDLSFKKDDKIQVVERTEDANDWWTGKLNGVTGVFPGNYVAEI